MQASTTPDIRDTDTDVLVIGGTAAGCSAAIAAAREGLRVVVLEPTQSIGGVSANGVHRTCRRNTSSIGVRSRYEHTVSASVEFTAFMAFRYSRTLEYTPAWNIVGILP